MEVLVCTVTSLLLLTATINAQAPDDANTQCTQSEGAPTFPDNVKVLMDSYSYQQLLPGSGTGSPPATGAVWSDLSVDGNDVDRIINPTYVSIKYIH